MAITVPRRRNDRPGGFMLASQDIVTSEFLAATLARDQDSVPDLPADARRQRGQRFVRAITHEIRSPLTVILAYASAVLDHSGKLTAAEVAELMRAIESSARLAEIIIDDLETIADQGPVRFQPAVLDVHRFLSAIATDLQALAPTRELHFTFGTGPLSISVDPLRFRQVFANLVKNAHRHSRPGGKIFIHALGAADEVSVTVEDEGPGVADEDLERIFEPFYRAAGASGVEGSGLGLTISRMIVERQGGKIRATRGERGGLRVDLMFPAAAECVRLRQSRPVRQRSVAKDPATRLLSA